MSMHARSLRAGLLSIALSVLLGGAACAQAQPPAQTLPGIMPAFDIWQVKFDEPLTQIPEVDVGIIACGTDGGPPSLPLAHFTDYANCTPEASGLREIYFNYDDEQDYIALAMDSEYEFLHGGTSIYAHPVVISALVDDTGIVRGIRIVTDDGAPDNLRRVAVRLTENLQGRFGPWGLTCNDLPPVDGEEPVGNQFVHKVCTATDPATGRLMRLEGSYLRKKGQQAQNLETQEVNKGYYQSSTRLEIVEPPYTPM